MQSEQEQLAQLVGVEDLEPVITGDILADGLRESLGAISNGSFEYVAPDNDEDGEVVSPIKRVGLKTVTSSVKNTIPQTRIASEKTLLKLYDVHDNLIEAFEQCPVNSALSDSLSINIIKLGSCISEMGGDIEVFEPLNHISGLDIPNVVKNAEEVVQRTIQCYKLGDIKNARIKENGKEIHMVFEGVSGNTRYAASGRIVAKGWTGNEAIDYVYTPNSGKMSVKAFEGGRWVNKGLNNDYHISWELEEFDIDQDISEKSAKNINHKKEIELISQNNSIDESDDGEEDIGTPIR